MNPLATELNAIIQQYNPYLLEMLSDIGKALFFPKGILSQSAEARQKAHRINATIGIATEHGHTMHFDSVMRSICDLRAKDALTYAPSFGIPELRTRWRQEQFEKNPSLAGKHISLPVVTCGITHAVSIFADLWLNPDDVVILPDMMWGNYNLILRVRKQAVIRHYPLLTEAGTFNLAAFEATVRQEAAGRSKICVLLNFPNNPTGYTISREEGEQIAKILTQIADEGTHVMAVFDDAYFGLFYTEDAIKESVFALLANSHPRLLAVKLDGATKEAFVWGLRVGFITYGCGVVGDVADLEEVYRAFEKKTAGCIRGSISNASHLSQSIFLKAMRDKAYPIEKAEKFEILKRRAQGVKRVLNDPKYAQAWDPYPFNSGYFMCLRLKSVDAEELRRHLLEKYGVGLIAIGKHNLRVAFSCLDEDQIPELFDTLLQGVNDLARPSTEPV